MTEKLGRYEILEEIGQGGFAVVYRAHDTQLDRLVALKELRPMLLADPGSVKSFRQEARNIAHLDHPGVVTIYDVYEAEQRLFIVMQLVDGSSLAELINKRGRLSWSETVELIAAVAAGLGYAHTRGILHRDLKPANILSDSNHGPMLSDFGLAKLIGEAGTNVTVAGGVVGTPHYIAPEVWEGQGTTRQSDIYALGCVLFEMLIGEKLFPGETPPAVMMAHFQPLALPSTWPEGVPFGVADVLAIALAQKPGDRYATATEMAQALAALTTLVKSKRDTTQFGSARPETKSLSPPILTTKLYPPPTRPTSSVVPRLHLIERLNEGLHRTPGLTLVSAPAGFGKTTLVSEWVNNLQLTNDELGLDAPRESQIANRKSKIQNRVAWLSLDDGDNDPTRFFTYFIAALQQIDPNIGQTVQSMLQSPQPPPMETLMTTLINEISTSSTDARRVFILDDYHLIEARPINDALSFLLDHLPPPPGGMHLVIATRDDPHLPLARLRARGQLTELRATDLRFTASEAAEFLNQVMGLDLSAQDIAALESRTEGWIAGLQLAALALQGLAPQGTISMQGHQNATSFIKSFTGSHHFILDYLIEEVLEQQPESIQTFLLQTAILDRLTGPLCDAVLNRGAEGQGSRGDFSRSPLPSQSSAHLHINSSASGQEVLEYLEHANLFIVPLDGERRWYRYHHLFADLLRQRLYQTQKEQVPTLHIRASEWFEQNGFADEAIEYALRAEDFERAARLIEELAETVWGRGEHNKLWGWLKVLPTDLVLSRPRLCIFRAWVLFAHGQQDAAELSLQAAEQVLDSISTTGTVEALPTDQDQLPELNKNTMQGRVATIRAFMASFRGDWLQIIQYSRQALKYLPAQDSVWRSSAAIALGDAYSFNGDVAAAHRARLEGLEASNAAGNIYLILIASLKMAVNLRQQGQLQQVIEICEQQAKLASESGLSQSAMAGSLFAVWGEVLCERNDLGGAIDHVKKGVELSEQGRDIAIVGWSYLCLVRVLFSGQDLVGAAEAIHKMENIGRKSDIPPWITNQLAAWQARIWLAQNKLDVAAQWVQQRGLSIDGELPNLRETEYIVLARILMAQGQLSEATILLQRLLETAAAGGRTTRLIEMLMLQALICQAGYDTAQAMTTLKKALTLAKPGGYIRIFVDEGPAMARLLHKATNRKIALDYAGKLLAAFPNFEPPPTAQSNLKNLNPVPRETEGSEIVEPLSERELEVLQLIAEGLTNQEIATRLFLTLNTVKVHTRNIYGKLNVHSRTQAIARSQELGLLPRQ